MNIEDREMSKLKTLNIDEKSRAEMIRGGSGPSRMQRMLLQESRPYQRHGVVVVNETTDDVEVSNGSPSTLRMLAGRLTSAIQGFFPTKLFSSAAEASPSITGQIIQQSPEGKNIFTLTA